MANNHTKLHTKANSKEWDFITSKFNRLNLALYPRAPNRQVSKYIAILSISAILFCVDFFAITPANASYSVSRLKHSVNKCFLLGFFIALFKSIYSTKAISTLSFIQQHALLDYPTRSNLVKFR